jgi:hypothetical protein
MNLCKKMFCDIKSERPYLQSPFNIAHPSIQDALDYVLNIFGKLLRRRGALAWFHGIWTCGVEVLEY